MGKRLISANASEILGMNAEELKQSIKASEGRVILSENVATRESFIGDITNSEIARAFGADLILLNGVDVLKPYIFGLEVKEESFVKELQNLVGRPIGVNLEPVDLEANMAEDRLTISKGRQANLETIKEIERLGMNFVCFTGNPGTGVTNTEIEKTIKLAKKYFSGLIIAGKMHGAGVDEPVADMKAIESFIEAGADVILVPAVGTVPGFDESELKEYFIEFDKYDDCRFGSRCIHENEPSCAVKEAVENGEISKKRYESYIQLLNEIRSEKRRY